MMKFTVTALILVTCVACGSASAPTRFTTEPFTIVSEQPDSAGTGLTVDLKLSEPVTQSSARSIAQSVISNRKDRYQNIIVRSYLASASARDIPYVVSRLERGTVTHQFNSETLPQPIPTH